MSLLKFDFQHRERTKLVVLTLFACFGILYLAPKILSIHGGSSEDYFDFQLFWQAGKIWASGGNPYDATVIPTGEGSNSGSRLHLVLPALLVSADRPLRLDTVPAGTHHLEDLEFFSIDCIDPSRCARSRRRDPK